MPEKSDPPVNSDFSVSTTLRYELVVVLPRNWKGRVHYRLVEALRLADITVPSGFETDGASVPRWAWPMFPPVGRYFAAAVVHDYLLQQGISWQVSNASFRRALRQLGIRGWRVGLLYSAVTVYGWWRTWRS